MFNECNTSVAQPVLPIRQTLNAAFGTAHVDTTSTS